MESAVIISTWMSKRFSPLGLMAKGGPSPRLLAVDDLHLHAVGGLDEGDDHARPDLLGGDQVLGPLET